MLHSERCEKSTHKGRQQKKIECKCVDYTTTTTHNDHTELFIYSILTRSRGVFLHIFFLLLILFGPVVMSINNNNRQSTQKYQHVINYLVLSTSDQFLRVSSIFRFRFHRPVCSYSFSLSLRGVFNRTSRIWKWHRLFRIQ